MTLTQITIAFFSLMAVVLMAMLVHGFIDRRRIVRRFSDLAVSLSGTVRQVHAWSYPTVTATRNGRTLSAGFQVVKAGRRHVLYLIYGVTVKLGFSLLLLREGVHRPYSDEDALAAISGPILPEIDPRYRVHATDAEAARDLLMQTSLLERLAPLEGFSSLLIGPDALVAGKPCEDLSEIAPALLRSQFEALLALAEAVEGKSSEMPSEQAPNAVLPRR